MFWQTYDLPRDRLMTVPEQVRHNLSRPWWFILRKLAIAGFLNTEEGCYVRLRDFTPFFWRTLVARERRRASRNIDWIRDIPPLYRGHIEREAVDSFVENFLARSKVND